MRNDIRVLVRGPVQLTWGGATDRGRVRPTNEDAIVVGPPVFAVADGMGGHVGGAVASEIVATRLATLAGRTQLTVAEVLDALESAKADLQERAAAEPDLEEMGSTVTGIAVVSEGGVEHWMVFNVGDSRVYRLRDDRLEQLTMDHSEVEDLVRAGALSAEQAASYPRRNVVTRSMSPSYPAAVDHWLIPPTVGERLIACSDGLVSEVSGTRITDIVSAARDAQGAADALVAAAVDAGGRDNVSVVVVDVADVDRPAGDIDTSFDGIDQDTAPRKVAR